MDKINNIDDLRELIPLFEEGARQAKEAKRKDWHARFIYAAERVRQAIQQGEDKPFVCPHCGKDCRPNGDPHLGTCAGPPVAPPPPWRMQG